LLSGLWFRVQADAAAKARVARWRDWKSTPDQLHPGAATHDQLDDVAAVVAGSKPAAVFWVWTIGRGQQAELAELLRMGLDQGLEVFGNGEYLEDISLVVGLPENVKALKQLVKGDHSAPGWERKVSLLLGYHAETVRTMHSSTEVCDEQKELAADSEASRAWWNGLPGYKKLGYKLRRCLEKPSNFMAGRNAERTAEAIRKVVRASMPLEKLGISPTQTAPAASEAKPVPRNQGRTA